MTAHEKNIVDAQTQTNAVREMLVKISDLWKIRAAVNKPALEEGAIPFHGHLADFSERLLPFSNHDAWNEASKEQKEKCLSYAWIIYNSKTVHIECDIVSPACEDLIKAPAVAKNQFEVMQVMTEALLDEALHTKMSVSACRYLYERRSLEYLRFTDYNLISFRDQLLAQCRSEGERRLTRFGIACASETLITDYLVTMTEDPEIQPICRDVTRVHAEDEWLHSSVFSTVAMDIIQGLSKYERQKLKDIIESTVVIFADNEMGAWEKVFQLVPINGSQDIVHDHQGHSELTIFKDSVNTLLQRLGLDV